MTNTPYTPLSRQQILSEFSEIVHEHVSLPRKIAAKHTAQPPQSSNHYSVLGRQTSEKAPSSAPNADARSEKLARIKKNGHNEGALHKAIEKHPFLLRTPELYVGGLYLNSILTERCLPSNLRPDFMYATAQGTVIKLVFVEIKSSKFNAFNGQYENRNVFHDDTIKPLAQVRGYKRSLKKHGVINVLLQNLEVLFERYPIRILDDNGALNPGIQIETGFMLVMGADELNAPWKQKLIDDLYLREGILMMTYPMMMNEVSQEEEVKNCLKVLTRSVEPVSIHKPDLLLVKVPSLNTEHAPLHDPDPYGVTMAGLGWPRAGAHRREEALYPQSLVSIFHRAQGQCERQDCTNPIVREGSFAGGLSSIYNFMKPRQPYLPALIEHMGLFCNEHCQDVNEGERYPMDRLHPLRASLGLRRGYRFETDREREVFLKQAIAQRTEAFCCPLGIDPISHPDIYVRIGQRLAALISLPIDLHQKMSAIVSQYYGIDRPVHTYQQPLVDIENDHDVKRLLQAGMIELEAAEGGSTRIRPTVIDQALIQMILEKFAHQASVILMGLCFGNNWIVQLGVNQASARKPKQA